MLYAYALNYWTHFFVCLFFCLYYVLSNGVVRDIQAKYSDFTILNIRHQITKSHTHTQKQETKIDAWWWLRVLSWNRRGVQHSHSTEMYLTLFHSIWLNLRLCLLNTEATAISCHSVNFYLLFVIREVESNFGGEQTSFNLRFFFVEKKNRLQKWNFEMNYRGNYRSKKKNKQIWWIMRLNKVAKQAYARTTQ